VAGLMPPAPAGTAITEHNYRFLQDYIYRETGIVIDGDKHYLIEARLVPVARAVSAQSLDALCEALRRDGQPQLRQQVVDAMTTNETLWFREPGHFEAMRSVMLPGFAASRPDRKLSVWSAAASSGQEIYSVAITLLEAGFGDWDLRLLGTDLSAQILERARAAKYLQMEVNRGLPAPYLVKYFEREHLDWRLCERVRRMVEFVQFDLRHPAGRFGKFDLVLCRNVLIYFDPATKRRILSEIAKTLNPGGYLLLGTAETILNLDVPFERKLLGQTVVYQASEAAGPVRERKPA
jgi:chemotaxis protein methyltransferase CheR